jgi:hypothetical protein
MEASEGARAQALKMKLTFVGFKKIRTKILDINNIELYQCVKPQLKKTF